MQKIIGYRPWLVAIAAGTALVASGPVWAQGSGLSSIDGAAGQSLRNNLANGKAPAASALPAAIPGAKARQPAAPASRPGNEMDPNEALFDAIDRGDIAAARDALNRGADLNSVNVLGLTPMALSVDLGRNDISFLLLSMRGEDSGRGSREPARGRRPAGGEKPAPLVAAKPDNHPRPIQTAPARVAAQKPAAAPKLWANDGGTPQPSAGFLGFGSRQASN